MKKAKVSLIGGQAANDFVESISPNMRGLEALMLEVAQSDIPVLLLAERGAGKEATARRIHELSRQSEQPFRVIACGESVTDKLSETADLATPGGGTIYVDELAALDASAQSWLLQAVSREHVNGGASQNVFRFICGSTRDVEAEVRVGNFREDLYYRLSGVCLRLPPLRQRKEDIPLLLEHFLARYAADFRRSIPELSSETRRLFLEYSWPGNVSEMENAVKAIVAIGDEAVAMGGLRAMLQRTSSSSNGNGDRISLKQASRAASREREKEIIMRALTRTRWNRRRAAQDLQISYKALLYKLKQMGCTGCEASQP